MPIDAALNEVLPTGWISLNDLALRLGVHPATLFRWRRTGVRGARLRTTRIGGRTGVQAPHLAEFLAQLNGTTDAAASPMAPKGSGPESGRG